MRHGQNNVFESKVLIKINVLPWQRRKVLPFVMPMRGGPDFSAARLFYIHQNDN